MKAVVDAETCTGCGICVDICPEVYQFDGDVAKAIVQPVPSALEDTAAEAGDSCPVDAIQII